jgi:hypothetical protein
VQFRELAGTELNLLGARDGRIPRVSCGRAVGVAWRNEDPMRMALLGAGGLT